MREGTSGAAFRLDRPVAAGAALRIDAWEASLLHGYGVLTVETTSPDAAAYERPTAVQYAQKALDVLAVNGGGAYRIRDSRQETIHWRPHPSGGLSVEALGLFELPIPFGMQVERTNVPATQAGKEAARPAWSPAFRFFRLAQTDPDVWSAFRSTYLACEHLLAAQTPPRKGEREREWIQRAVTEFDKAHPAVGGKSWLEALALDSFVDVVYQSTRHSLFHAKHGSPFQLPLDEDSDAKVHDAFLALTRMFLELAPGRLRWPLNSRPQTEANLTASGTWLLPFDVRPFEERHNVTGDASNRRVIWWEPSSKKAEPSEDQGWARFPREAVKHVAFIDGWELTNHGQLLAVEELPFRIPTDHVTELTIRVVPRVRLANVIRTSFPN